MFCIWLAEICLLLMVGPPPSLAGELVELHVGLEWCRLANSLMVCRIRLYQRCVLSLLAEGVGSPVHALVRLCKMSSSSLMSFAAEAFLVA